jgi:hypothetical protein
MKNKKKAKEKTSDNNTISKAPFKPLTTKDLIEILDVTIKKDDSNKVATLIGCILTYTEDSQINISFNAPSSTGKSYIALEIAKLFPKADVIKLGNCSKTAFFHEQGKYNKEKNEFEVDLSKKILIFTDAPHMYLLESLRSLLSHDEKIMYSKITDKSTTGGLKTKNVALIGFPSVIFCTAGLKMDLQEITRFIMLSPEMGQEKLRAGIENAINKESNADKYKSKLDSDKGRASLINRIIAIKEANIKDIKINNIKAIHERFLSIDKVVQPRHQRDIKRFISIVKGFTLLNLWHRDRVGDTLMASKQDVEDAIELWNKISVPQELNIPPYVHMILTEVIMPVFAEKNEGQKDKIGVSRDEIMKKHLEVTKNRISIDALRFDILPTLHSAGLITKEKDKNDARVELISVCLEEINKNNSGFDWGSLMQGELPID